MTLQAPTPDLIRAALTHIPANCARDVWARVAMAIKSEFPDDVGRDLFTDWSATAESYNAADTLSTWRSIRAGGGVTIGTLLHLAKEHGFVLPKGGTGGAVSPKAKAAHDARRKQREAKEQAAREAAQAKAATEVQSMWDAASEVVDPSAAPYLLRKGVQPYGVRFSEGVLLVPLRDSAGWLWNVQRIAPAKPTRGPDKLFQKDGRKSGLWHWCGDPAGAGVLLVAEGYATAATLHEATGLPVAVAFDAGNLGHVAKALRQLYPPALLVLCGDDDAGTQRANGSNPGRDKAMAAAKAVRGLAVFPEGLPEGGSDFNDLYQHVGGAAGLATVGSIVQAAIDKHEATQRAAQARQAPTAADCTNGTSQASTGLQNGKAQRMGSDRFFVAEGGTDAGLYHVPFKDGEDGRPQRVCGVLRVVGLARDSHDNQAALLLEFVTQFGKVRRWLMPLAMLAGDGNAYRVALNSQGFMTPTNSARRALLTEYLASRDPAALELVRHVSRVGWAGRCYVLPNETLGRNVNGEQVIFHSEAGIEANFSQRGTVEQWRSDLARLCVGNSRAAFAVATAFAGPLLAWASGTTGGGLHYTGQTSIGKTTCFLLAASVWGKGTEKDPDSYVQKWRATSNGLEYQGEQHNDCTLILDELGQMDAADAGNAAYMLADGMGKTRGRGVGGLRPKPTWRLLFLSSGELTLAQHMETVGKKMKGGQEVRLIPIPTEVRDGSALETFHEFSTGHELSGYVQHHAARCYGVAGRAWLEYLVAHTDGMAADLRERMDAIEAQLVPTHAVGQVKRGGRRFALIAAAGELATEAGITGWQVGQATWAAKACFDSWLAMRGGAGSSEKAAMLRQVRSFLETHGDGRFAMWHRGADDHAPKTLQRAGVRRMLNEDGQPIKTNSQHGAEFGDTMPAAVGEAVSYEYFILSETFKAEVCKGYDVQAVCSVLAEHQCLNTKEPGRFSIKTKLPGIGAARCYVIPPAIFELDL